MFVLKLSGIQRSFKERILYIITRAGRWFHLKMNLNIKSSDAKFANTAYMIAGLRNYRDILSNCALKQGEQFCNLNCRAKGWMDSKVKSGDQLKNFRTI